MRLIGILDEGHVVGGRPVEIDGFRFLNPREAARYCELKQFENAGEIEKRGHYWPFEKQPKVPRLDAHRLDAQQLGAQQPDTLGPDALGPDALGPHLVGKNTNAKANINTLIYGGTMKDILARQYRRIRGVGDYFKAHIELHKAAIAYAKSRMLGAPPQRQCWYQQCAAYRGVIRAKYTMEFGQGWAGRTDAGLQNSGHPKIDPEDIRFQADTPQAHTRQTHTSQNTSAY